jgi:hypothetical protein
MRDVLRSLLVLLAVNSACAPGRASEETGPAEMPKECSAYLDTYSSCVGKLGTRGAALAQTGQARTRGALMEQLKQPNGGAQAKTQCSAALAHLNAACR